MAQSLGHQRMEELLQLNLGITYELLNQLEQAISCHTLVSERYASAPFLIVFSPCQYLGMVVQRGELKKQAEGFSTLARLYLETGQFTKAHEYYLNVSQETVFACSPFLSCLLRAISLSFSSEREIVREEGCPRLMNPPAPTGMC